MSHRPRGRIEELAERYSLPGGAVEQLLALLKLLRADPAAATSVRTDEGILNDHLADSLVALELPVVWAMSRAADIGAGAGLPGIPLAIARPEAEVVLLEANGRKCGFLARAKATCELANVRVVNARAEEWQAGFAWCDLVTARALAPLAVVAEYAAPLLSVGGSLVAWRGARDQDGEAAAARAASLLGLKPQKPLHVRPYPEAEHRYLHVMSKVRDTPAGFPRRAGMARKRPLGGAD
jgi:16S rRNA (guanine527-N7)-methyltransferase